MRSKKLKGRVGTPMIVFFLGLLIAITLVSVSDGRKIRLPSIVMEQRTDIYYDFYNTKNALQSADTYLNMAHSYSLYQALYDNLKHGGYESETVPDDIIIKAGDVQYAKWYNTKQIITVPEWDYVWKNIKESFSNKLETYLVDYSFLNKYVVSLPSKDDFIIEKLEYDNGKISLETKTNDDKKLELANKHETYGEIILKKSFSFNKEFEIKAKELFEKAKEFFNNFNPEQNFKNVIESELASKKSSWPAIGSGTKSQSNEDILQSTFSDFENTKNEIKEHFENLDKLNKETTEHVTVNSETVNYKTSYSVEHAELYADISCTEIAGQDKKECSFVYNIKLALKVEVSDMSNEYPVSNEGQIISSPMVVRYYLVYGDLDEIAADEYTPPSPSITEIPTTEIDGSTVEDIAKYYANLNIPFPEKFKTCIFAQWIHETGWFTSNAWNNYNNPGGLKYRSGLCPETSGVAISGETGEYCVFETEETGLSGYFSWIETNSRYPNLDADLESISNSCTDNRDCCVDYINYLENKGYNPYPYYSDRIVAVLDSEKFKNDIQPIFA